MATEPLTREVDVLGIIGAIAAMLIRNTHNNEMKTGVPTYLTIGNIEQKTYTWRVVLG